MSFLKITQQNHITTISLNRPDVRNAFDETMIAEMTQAFKALSSQEDLRVLVLRGEGPSFCAGGDLNWMKSMVDYSESENRVDSEKLFEMYQALIDVPVPVVSLVHGHVMGGGLGLVAASDICFAESDTQFCFSEVRLGLAPAVISAFVLGKIQPMAMHRYFLSAEVFDSQAAQQMGLVNEMGSMDEMEQKLTKITKKISSNGPQAVRQTKKLIRQIMPSSDLKQVTTELIAKLRVSPEGQEGLKAFFEKRKPNWLEGS